MPFFSTGIPAKYWREQLWNLSALVGESGGDGQVLTLRLVSVLISNESQSDLLALGRDVIVGSLLSVARVVALVFAVSVLGVAGQLLLSVGLVTGGVVRSGVAIQSIKISLS